MRSGGGAAAEHSSGRAAYYQPRQRSARGLDEAMVARIRKLHQEEPNCGVRGTWSRLRFRDGLRVNCKKVHRTMKHKECTLPKRRMGRGLPFGSRKPQSALGD